MPEPISTGLLLKTVGVAAGSAVVEGIFDRFSNRELKELRDEVLNQQVAFTNDLARKSRGKYTEAEIRAIEEAAEPQLNAIAGDVASRGLAFSGAGASVLADARQQLFSSHQAAATVAYPQALLALSQTVNTRLGTLSRDRSVVDDLRGILKDYLYVKGRADKTGVDPDTDVGANSALSIIFGNDSLFGNQKDLGLNARSLNVGQGYRGR